MDRVVIVGAGHAGVELAASLRKEGFSGEIVLLSAERELPYQRPPLSKDQLGGRREALPLKAERFYEENAIDLQLGCRASGIDRNRRLLEMGDGGRLAYDHLVLATGARCRPLPLPGFEDPRILRLRTLDDARRLSARLPQARRVTVIGGGFTGLELAAGLREQKVEVDVVEAEGRLLSRSVSAPLANYLQDWHARSGTKLHLSASVEKVERAGRGYRVHLTGQGLLGADLVVVATGTVANVELAAVAGLDTRDGVLVDDRLRTGDQRISAIGDCARFPSVHTGGLVRIESVQNATDQARCLARQLVGRDETYDDLPWFWSNQGALRLQIAGLATGGEDCAVTGEVSSRPFVVSRRREGELVAVETLNSPRDHLLARRQLSACGPSRRNRARDVAA